MRIEQEFWNVYRAFAEAPDATTGLVPTYLACAAAAVLPVDGASISFTHTDFRVPLGADSVDSAVAERLQFTVGDGPCMQAGKHRMVIDAPTVLLRSRWPTLAQEWAEHTPYRSATSIPIPLPEPTSAALNLFFTGPESAGLRPIDASVVAALIGAELVTSSPAGAVGDLLDTPQAGARLRVWVAVGMVSKAFELTAGDALARLRSHAYAGGATAEAVAARLIDDPALVADLAL